MLWGAKNTNFELMKQCEDCRKKQADEGVFLTKKKPNILYNRVKNLCGGSYAKTKTTS